MTKFHPELHNLTRMPSEMIMFRELQAVTPLSYNPLRPSSRVTLLGDAAHAMTTHRGQGANITFLDAVDLANAIKSGCGILEYEDILFRRGFKAVKESKQSTNGIHSTGIFAYFIWWLFYTIGTIVWLRKKK